VALVSLRPEVVASDPDQLLARFRSNWPEIRRISAARNSAFAARTGRIRTRSLAVIEVKTSGYCIGIDASAYMVVTIPSAAGLVVASGRREWRTAGGAAHYADGRPFQMAFADNFRGYHVCVEKRAFRETAESWCGEPLPTTIRESSLFDAAEMNTLSVEIEALEREAAEGTLAELTPKRERDIEARFHAALLSSPLGELAQTVGATGQAAAAAVARARDFIRAEYAEPFSARDLARAAGSNLRNLQAAFRRTHGASPWQYLTMCRLEAARRRLRSPAEPATVTQIATDAGFTHLGEFGRLYRERFGERPTETRRRALGKYASDSQFR